MFPGGDIGEEETKVEAIFADLETVNGGRMIFLKALEMVKPDQIENLQQAAREAENQEAEKAAAEARE